MDNGETPFQPSLLAKLLHSLPHYNVTFHLINNTFRPKNEVYVEVRGLPICDDLGGDFFKIIILIRIQKSNYLKLYLIIYNISETKN